MTNLTFTLACPIHDSFRVQQIAGMFDVPLAERSQQTIRAELPDLDGDWQIGLIVGPSGSGKTTLGRRLFGHELYESADWPRDRAIMDGFGDMPVKEIVSLLTAVGFSSPPGWIKPYHVLSNGERFRCDLARALGRPLPATDHGQLTTGRIIAFDEFTSVVDRTVAKIASAAVAKAIRSRRVACRFVAITCHYDIARWLSPDWIIDMATGQSSAPLRDVSAAERRATMRRRLRRPTIRLELFRCGRSAWDLFARHHYLSGQLARAARCYIAMWNHNPITFVATLPILGRRNHWRITRIVTLPDYQGIGIGMRVAEAVAELHRAEGKRINVTARHPALLAHCCRSPLWRTVLVKKAGARGPRLASNYRDSIGRAIVSFEYLGKRKKEPRMSTDETRMAARQQKSRSNAASGTAKIPALCRQNPRLLGGRAEVESSAVRRAAEVHNISRKETAQ